MNSNYPPGLPAPRNTTVDMWCDACGNEWEAEAVYDLGTYTLRNESDDICPNCGEVAD